jgi:hypothetical protein
MVADCTRDADAARFGQCLQTCRNINPVPEYVALFNDHIAEVDPNAEPDPALFGQVRLAIIHPALDLDRAAHCIDYARELGKEAVTGILHDPAPVFGDLGIDHLAEVRFEPFVRPFLIGAHETRVTGHISGEDGGEAAGRGHGWGRPLRSKVRSLNHSTNSRITTSAPRRPPPFLEAINNARLQLGRIRALDGRCPLGEGCTKSLLISGKCSHKLLTHEAD